MSVNLSPKFVLIAHQSSSSTRTRSFTLFNSTFSPIKFNKTLRSVITTFAPSVANKIPTKPVPAPISIFEKHQHISDGFFEDLLLVCFSKNLMERLPHFGHSYKELLLKAINVLHIPSRESSQKFPKIENEYWFWI